MVTTNTSPTLDDLNAIEIEWNAAINTACDTAVARYPDLDIALIDMGRGSQFLSSVHPTTNEPMVQVRRSDNLQPYSVPRDFLNAYFKKSLLLDLTDEIIHHSCDYVLDDDGLIMLQVSTSSYLNDRVEQDEEGNDINVPGLSTLLASNKVNIVTEDNGIKRIVKLE